MLSMNTEIAVGTLLQVLGYVIVAVGLYFGIKLDLQASRTKADSAAKQADAAHELAGEAHEKIYDHVTQAHAGIVSNHSKHRE